MQGSDVFYPRVLGLGTAARELLLENGVEFAWRDSDRVIFMHQGYQFDFLRGGGSDPEVWSYCEGSMPGEPTLSFASFSEWLEAQVRQQTAAWSRLVPWYEAENRRAPVNDVCSFSDDCRMELWLTNYDSGEVWA